ncbi:MAG: hypothetical protein ACRD3M_01985 [Thermoanaerobaculia bacterium]
MDRRGMTLGVALVGVGLYALLSRYLDLRGPGAVLLLLGAFFFAASALRRFRGPLFPAGVLIGLGLGFFLRRPLEPWMPHWAAILLGLGGGFLLVAALDAAAGRHRQPPPLVPGAVLTAIALGAAASRALSIQDLLAPLEPLWPFAVLAAGFWLVASALKRRAT